MKELIIIAAVLAISFSRATAEVAPSHAAVIEKMLTVLKLDKKYETSMMAMTGFESALGFFNTNVQSLTKQERDKLDKIIARMKTRVMEILSWEKVKKEMVAIYAKIFTEKEAADVIALMDCPAGQMLVTKQMALASEVEQMMQDKVTKVQPQIDKIIREEPTD